MSPEQQDGPTPPRYAAFLSYRHVDPDRSWAAWLHAALENWRTPRRLVRERGLPRRLGRVFRDEEELHASHRLSSAIDEALEQSRYLIVVCSPRTPASRWVNQEVVRFREMGREDKILALLVDGEPSEAFPEALRPVRRPITGASGASREEIEEVEPLAADVRPTAGESTRYLKRMALLRLLANLLGCRFDDLRRREQERRTRKLLAAGAFMAVLLVLFAVLAGVAVHQRSRAEEALAYEEGARARADELTAFLMFDLRDRLATVGKLEILRDAAFRAKAYYETLPPRYESDEAMRSRGVAWTNVGDVFAALGDLDEALESHRHALRIAEHLHGQAPNVELWKHDVAVSLSKVAEVLQDRGELEDAAAHQRRGLEIAGELAGVEGSRRQWRRDVGVFHQNLGRILMLRGDLDGAQSHYEKALAVQEGLLADDEGDRQVRRDLALTYERLGDVWLPRGDLIRARAAYERDLAGIEELLSREPGNIVWARDAAHAHNRMGDAL
ncbi:MAG: toll/interleukin-1 receptor domain-containing protein, partial [Planctomycetota bacterium]